MEERLFMQVPASSAVAYGPCWCAKAATVTSAEVMVDGTPTAAAHPNHPPPQPPVPPRPCGGGREEGKGEGMEVVMAHSLGQKEGRVSEWSQGFLLGDGRGTRKRRIDRAPHNHVGGELGVLRQAPPANRGLSPIAVPGWSWGCANPAAPTSARPVCPPSCAASPPPLALSPSRPESHYPSVAKNKSIAMRRRRTGMSACPNLIGVPSPSASQSAKRAVNTPQLPPSR